MNGETPMRAPGEGAVAGWPLLLLRLEGAAVLALSALLYAGSGGGWLRFLLLFFVPDLSMLAYLGGPAVGAAVYNAAHAYVGPLALAALSIATGSAELGLGVGLIWTAHIGFDRMLGYGLKYASAFADTHLGRIGRGPGRG